MTLFAKIRSVVLLVLAIGILCLASYVIWNFIQVHKELASAKKELANYRQAAITQSLIKQTETRDKEYALAWESAQRRTQTNEATKALHDHVAVLQQRLRNAEARSITVVRVPVTPTITGPSTIARQPDQPVVLATIGSEDVDEAHRADTIRIEYLACKSQYDAVREELSK